MLIVPGRPGIEGLTWWIYSPDGIRPTQESLRLTAGSQVIAATANEVAAVKVIHGLWRSGDPTIARNIFVVATTGLRPDMEYSLSSLSAVSSDAVTSRTLPPLSASKPITMGVGSCYGRVRGRNVDQWVKLKDIFNDRDNPIRFRFLCGDQIYMDLDPATDDVVDGKPNSMLRYQSQWIQDVPFRRFLASSPTMTLADDHEFWNNYPDRIDIPFSSKWKWAENELGGPVGQEFDRAFALFQAGLNLDPRAVVDDTSVENREKMDRLLRDDARTFSIDLGFLNILALDVRTRRTSMSYDGSKPKVAVPHFDPQAAGLKGGVDSSRLPDVSWLEKVKDWLGNLQTPGVLILSQPLV